MSPPRVIYYKASHWPSNHMISSRPLIVQPSFPPSGGLFYFIFIIFLLKAPSAAAAEKTKIEQKSHHQLTKTV